MLLYYDFVCDKNMINELKLLTYLYDVDTVELLIDIIVNRMAHDHTISDNDRFINDVRYILTNDPNIRDFIDEAEINDEFVESFIKNNEEEIREKYKQKQHSWIYNTVLQIAMTIKEPLYYQWFINHKSIKGLIINDLIASLTDDELQELYERYCNNYAIEHNGRRPFFHPQIININEKLKKYVIEHDDLLSLSAFKRVISGWSLPKNINVDELFDRYCRMYNEKPGNHVQYALRPGTGLIGYKGKNKREWLGDYNTDNKRNTTNYFPLKSNIKQYQTHKVSSRNSYMIDLMIEKRKYYYLVVININTRYLIVEPLNIEIESKDGVIRMTRAKKNIDSFIRVLDKVLSVVTINHLYGDNEPAFVSNEAKNHYRSHSIVWHSVPRMIITDYDTVRKTEPQHTSLGIVDRVIRTIRDIGWNIKEKTITPTIMKSIVDQYNNAPHKTLSHYAGFLVSPLMVQRDKSLEEYITREIMKENYNIVRSSMLHVGDKVKVYNVKDPMIKRRTMIVPGEHHITGFKNGYYKVRDNNSHTQQVPRYRLALM